MRELHAGVEHHPIAARVAFTTILQGQVTFQQRFGKESSWHARMLIPHIVAAALHRHISKTVHIPRHSLSSQHSPLRDDDLYHVKFPSATGTLRVPTGTLRVVVVFPTTLKACPHCSTFWTHALLSGEPEI